MNKANVRNKLLPAVAMLAVSATVLTTASYAWFTMSKEVSVEGFDVTATTPDSLEITLGKASGETLLKPGAAGTDDTIWSNKATFSSVYHNPGKLKPASSANGFELFHTVKATEGGKVPSAQATADTFEVADKAVGLSVNTATSASTEEGYYLDIPVWIRTRGAQNVNLGMQVKVTSDTKDAQNLYKAVRVALLKESSGSYSPTATGGESVWAADPQSAAYMEGKVVVKADAAAEGAKEYPHLVDITAENLKFIVPVTAIGNDGVATNGTPVLQVKGSADAAYGTPTEFVVRIWIEGQDNNCLDLNAGQHFKVDLAFINAGTVNP